MLHDKYRGSQMLDMQYYQSKNVNNGEEEIEKKCTKIVKDERLSERSAFGRSFVIVDIEMASNILNHWYTNSSDNYLHMETTAKTQKNNQ